MSFPSFSKPFLPWAMGYENWHGIILAGQNKEDKSHLVLCRLHFLWALSFTLPLSLSLGGFAQGWLCSGQVPWLVHGNTQPWSVLTVIPCSAICEDDASSWRTFSTVPGFPVFSLFLMLPPLLTQFVILGSVFSLPFPFSGKYNTFAVLLNPASEILKKVSEMSANPGKTTNCSRCQKWKQLDHHLEIIAIVSQQHKSITYNGRSMAEATYVFAILKYQFLNHM